MLDLRRSLAASTPLCLLSALLLTGCPETTTPVMDAGPQLPLDAGREPDAGAGDDAGPQLPLDAGPVDDAGLPMDSGSGGEDAGSNDDAGPASDAGSDGGPMADAGPDDCMDRAEIPDRPTAPVCSPCRPVGIAPGTGGAGGGGGGPTCVDDSDCTEGDNGRCSFMRFGTACTYDQCFVDSDCATDQVCACDGGSSGENRCISANCQTNADCQAGYECTSTLGSCGNYTPPVGYYCHMPGDACLTDEQCQMIDAGPFGFGGATCRYLSDGDGTMSWQCSSLECAG